VYRPLPKTIFAADYLCSERERVAVFLNIARKESSCPNGGNSIAAQMAILGFWGASPLRRFYHSPAKYPIGGRLSHIELGEFLRSPNGPEHQALLRLIGSLVDVPPYASRQTSNPEGRLGRC
jgi:hypothetical protein